MVLAFCFRLYRPISEALSSPMLLNPRGAQVMHLVGWEVLQERVGRSEGQRSRVCPPHSIEAPGGWKDTGQSQGTAIFPAYLQHNGCGRRDQTPTREKHVTLDPILVPPVPERCLRGQGLRRAHHAAAVRPRFVSASSPSRTPPSRQRYTPSKPKPRARVIEAENPQGKP